MPSCSSARAWSTRPWPSDPKSAGRCSKKSPGSAATSVAAGEPRNSWRRPKRTWPGSRTSSASSDRRPGAWPPRPTSRRPDRTPARRSPRPWSRAPMPAGTPRRPRLPRPWSGSSERAPRSGELVGSLSEAEAGLAEIGGRLARRTALEVERRDALESARAALAGLQLAAGRQAAELEAARRDRVRLDDERAAAEAELATRRRALALPVPERDSPLQASLEEAELGLADARRELAALEAASQAEGQERAALERAMAARTAEHDAARRQLADAERRAAEERDRATGRQPSMPASRPRSRRPGPIIERRSRPSWRRPRLSMPPGPRPMQPMVPAEPPTSGRPPRGRDGRDQQPAAAATARQAEEEARGIARAARRVGGRRVDAGLQVDPAFRAAVEAALGELARGYLVEADGRRRACRRAGLADPRPGRRAGCARPTAGLGSADRPALGSRGRGFRLGRRPPAAFRDDWLRSGVACLARRSGATSSAQPGRSSSERPGPPTSMRRSSSSRSFRPAGRSSCAMAGRWSLIGRSRSAGRTAAWNARVSSSDSRPNSPRLDRAGRSRNPQRTRRPPGPPRPASDSRRPEPRRPGSGPPGARPRKPSAWPPEASSGWPARLPGMMRRPPGPRRSWSADERPWPISRQPPGNRRASDRSTGPDTAAGGDQPTGRASATETWQRRVGDLRLRRDRLAAEFAEREGVRLAAEAAHARDEASASLSRDQIERADRQVRELAERETEISVERDRLALDLATAASREERLAAALAEVRDADSADRGLLAAAESAVTAARDRLRSAEERHRSAEVAELETRLALDLIREQAAAEIGGLGPLGLQALGLPLPDRPEPRIRRTGRRARPAQASRRFPPSCSSAGRP